MATNWSNTSAQNYVLYVRGRIQTNAPGIQSETQEDLLVFDTEYYRDELDSAFLGTARTLLQASGGAFNTIIANGLQVTSDTFDSFAAQNDPHMEQSDSFTHTPPHPLEKTRSRLYWWSGPTGTGNVVASCWADQYVTLSPSNYTGF